MSNENGLLGRPGGSVTSTTTQVIRNKFEKLKTLVLKLKPSNRHEDLSSMNPDQLDAFVDEMIADLENTLISNTNDLRERIKQIRPDPTDPEYDNKMIDYKELLEEMIPIMQKLHTVICQTLDELHKLVRQLWDDISQNNGENVDHLLEEHANQTELLMNEQWIKYINELEVKLRDIDNVNCKHE